jgi:hypothetical protein
MKTSNKLNKQISEVLKLFSFIFETLFGQNSQIIGKAKS